MSIRVCTIVVNKLFNDFQVFANLNSLRSLNVRSAVTAPRLMRTSIFESKMSIKEVSAMKASKQLKKSLK